MGRRYIKADDKVCCCELFAIIKLSVLILRFSNCVGAITSKNKFGLLSDLSNLWKALSGGAHIENNSGDA